MTLGAGGDNSGECCWLDCVGNSVDMKLWKAILINLRDLREDRPGGEKPETMSHGKEMKELRIFTQREK